MEKYQNLVNRLQKIKKSEIRLKILLDNKEILEEKVKKRRNELDKENYDVEKLDGLSLVGFIHFLQGTLMDKLEKEEKEALIAKNKYEYVLSEFKSCLSEIESCKQIIDKKPLLEREYKEFIDKSEDSIIAGKSDVADRIKKLIEKYSFSDEVIKEIDEALDAGNNLIESLLFIKNSFKRYRQLEMVNILDNGLIVSNNHEDIKIINEEIVLIQSKIRMFHIELLDVNNIYDCNLNIKKLLLFSDEFIDGVNEIDHFDEKLKFAYEFFIESNKIVSRSLDLLLECRVVVIKEKDQILKEKNILIGECLANG